MNHGGHPDNVFLQATVLTNTKMPRANPTICFHATYHVLKEDTMKLQTLGLGILILVVLVWSGCDSEQYGGNHQPLRALFRPLKEPPVPEKTMKGSTITSKGIGM